MARGTQLERLPSGQALAARLEALQSELSTAAQLEPGLEHRRMDSVASELLRPLVMRSRDGAVKQLAGCCLVDVLRVYAPEAPYSTTQLKAVFAFLLDRLRGLEQAQSSSSHQRSLYILRRLVECKSICLVAGLTDAPGDEGVSAEDLMVGYLEAAFDVLVPGCLEEVQALALELVEALCEEVDAFAPRFLDTILCRLLPERAKEAPAAKELAASVVRGLADRLREPVTALLNTAVSGVASSKLSARRKRRKKRTSLESALSDSDGDSGEDGEEEEEGEGDRRRSSLLIGGDEEAVELKDNLHELIFQLFKVEPSMLLYILPQLAVQLEVDDLEARQAAVELMGRIFCEVTGPTFLEENDRVLAAFLRRVHDVNTEIRLALVKFAGFALNRDTGDDANTEDRMMMVIDHDATTTSSTSGAEASQDDAAARASLPSSMDSRPEAAAPSQQDREQQQQQQQQEDNFWAPHFLAPNFLAKYGKTIAASASSDEDAPSFMELALVDKDVGVRRMAVDVVVDLLAGAGDALALFQRCGAHDHVLRSLAERLSDKRIDIATASLAGLTRCFATYLSERFWVARALRASREMQSCSSSSSTSAKRARRLADKQLQDARGKQRAQSGVTAALTSGDEELEEEEEEEEEEEVEEIVNMSDGDELFEDEQVEGVSALDTAGKSEQYAEQTLGWIPNELLKHHFTHRGADEALLYRLQLCSSLESAVFGGDRPEQSEDWSAAVRAFVLARFWGVLDSLGRSAFTRVFLEQRARLRSKLAQVGQLRDRSREKKASTSSRKGSGRTRRSLFAEGEADKADKGDKGGVQDEATRKAVAQGRELLRSIATEFVPKLRCPDAEDCLEKLWDVKDNFVFRDLQVMVDRKSTLSQVRKALSDCLKRLGSKSPESRLLRILHTRFSLQAIAPLELAHMLDEVVRWQATRRDDEGLQATCELASAVLDAFPWFASRRPSEVASAGSWILELAFARYCGGKGKSKGSSSSASVSAGAQRAQALLAAKATRKATRKVAVSLQDDAVRAACALAAHAMENLPRSPRGTGREDKARKAELEQVLDLLELMTLSSSDLPCARRCAKAWCRLFVQQDASDEAQERLAGLLGAVKAQVMRESEQGSEAATSLAALGLLLKHAPERCGGRELEMDKLATIVFDRVKRGYRADKRKDWAREAEVKEAGIKVICNDVLRRLRDWDRYGRDPGVVRKQVLLLRRLVADSGDPWRLEAERARKRHKDGGEQAEQEEVDKENAAANVGKAKPAAKPATMEQQWPPSSEPRFWRLRMAAGCALVKIEAACEGVKRSVLAEGKAGEEELRQVQRWVELSWLALDPEPAVREAIAGKIFTQYVRRGRELFRYGSFLVLASAASEAKGKSESFGKLQQLLAFLDREFAKRKRAAATSGGGQGFAQLAPECMVPPLIYLLAHHPQMPHARTAAQDFVCGSAGQRVVVRPLVVLFDALSNLSKQHEANAGLVYSMLDSIQRHSDALVPSSSSIHMVGEICQLLVKSRLKVSPDTLEFPGKVPLPKMYMPAPEVPRLGSPGVSPIARRGSSGSARGVRTPAWRRAGPEPALPARFELRLGGASLAAKEHAAATPKARKRRRKELVEKAAPVVTPPTRRQPARATKGKAPGGYVDNPSSDEDAP